MKPREGVPPGLQMTLGFLWNGSLGREPKIKGSRKGGGGPAHNEIIPRQAQSGRQEEPHRKTVVPAWAGYLQAHVTRAS